MIGIKSTIFSDSDFSPVEFHNQIHAHIKIRPMYFELGWLFQKKKLASVRLQRIASWDEAVIEYKSYWDQVNAGEIPKGLANFREFYQLLQGE